MAVAEPTPAGQQGNFQNRQDRGGKDNNRGRGGGRGGKHPAGGKPGQNQPPTETLVVGKGAWTLKSAPTTETEVTLRNAKG